MKYIEWKKLNTRDFMELLQNIKVGVSIYDDPFKDEYPLLLKKINKLLNNDKIELNGYEIKSLNISYKYIKSLNSLYKLDELIDNKNNYSQQKITSIHRNIYLYEDSKLRLNHSIGKRLSLIFNHLDNINDIKNNDKYYEASEYLNNFYNDYKNKDNKTYYFRNLYKNDLVDIDLLNNYFDILVNYYDKSIVSKKFIKVYEEFPIDKILEIEKIIGLYKAFMTKLNNFLTYNDCDIENIDFDLNKFIEEYNSYKYKDDFFTYLYIHNNISNSLLYEYINYYKKKYVQNYGNKYNSELGTLYKVSKIYEEYNTFLNNISIQKDIDKVIIDSYLDNNKDLDYMFFDLLNNGKLRNGKINSSYYEQLSSEELLRYSIIINFINNRLVTISSNEVFKDRIILSNPKNKKLYYDYMNDNFYKKRFKPLSKYVKFCKLALSDEDKKLVDEYDNIYLNYYNENKKDEIRTSNLNPKEVNEIEKVDMNKLLDIVNQLMNIEKLYVLLEFYRLSPYNVTTFYNLVKGNLAVNQKVFMNKFYAIYKDDITISEQRINDIIEIENLGFGLEDGTTYKVTKEDKQQVFILLKEEDIPITNRTFSIRLRKYFIENIKDNIINSKKLTKK